MEPIITSALIGAGGNLLGGLISNATSNSASREEYERQKEFAQNSISWRVADAKRAGLHPLYALNASGATYSPQSAVGDDYGLSAASNSFADIYSRNPSKAQKAMNIQQQKLNDLQIASSALSMKAQEADITKTKAETALIRSQIGSSAFGGFAGGTNNSFSAPSPTNIAGQSINGSSAQSSDRTYHVLTSNDPNVKTRTRAFGFDKVASQLQFETMPNGDVAIRPSKENTEDDFVKTLEALYHGNNKYMEKDFLKVISSAHPPPPGMEYELYTGAFGLQARLVPSGSAKPIDKNFIDWLVYKRSFDLPMRPARPKSNRSILRPKINTYQRLFK